MKARLRRLVVGVVAAVALVAGAGVLSAPAQALPASVNGFVSASVTIDCTSLQSGYYMSAQVASTITGLAPNTAYVLGAIRWTGWYPTAPLDPSIALTTDANGGATVVGTLAQNFVSGAQYMVQVSRVNSTGGQSTVVTANTCASGVTMTGAPTVTLNCPLRFLTTQGEGSTEVDFGGALGGFVPGQPYQFDFVNTATTVRTLVGAVADANGRLIASKPVTPDGLMANGGYTWSVTTTSQAAPIAQGTLTTTDPCAPIAKAPKRAALFHDSDVTGDGYGDLLVMDVGGHLLLYPNGIRSNPGGVPFSTRRLIGTGWGPNYGMRQVVTGDLTGDGVAEVVALRTDGTLVAYYNNIFSSPAGLPYSAATLIGTGWQSFTSISLGDVDGDGYADIVAEKSDGTRWFYKNRFLTDPLHRPFSTGVRIASDGLVNGTNLTTIGLADFNGDGYADLTPGGAAIDLNRTPAGNTTPFPASVPFTPSSSMDAPLGGWSTGDYEGRGSSGIVVANPYNNGQLLYLKDPLVPGEQPRVIGSGWSFFLTLIQ